MSKRTFVHIEIPAADRQAAKKFYGEMFGWDFEDMEEMDYTVFHDGKVGGGFNPLSDEIKPNDIIVYLESADIEADLKKIAELGGEMIMPKTEIPGIGWFAFFKDPTGNKLALYTSMNPS